MAYIELSRKNYFHNLDILSGKLGSVDKLSVVLKDNAYGHGLLQMAELSSRYGIKKAIVRTSDEAKQIASYFDYIIILAPKGHEEYHSKFRYVVNELEKIKKLPKNSSLHLKVDTGMHRAGIAPDELEDSYRVIKESGLILEALMTHYRSADELTSELFWQQKIWEEIKKEALRLSKKYEFEKPLFHSANSSTLLRVSNYKDDFARCGIATFGYHQLPPSFDTPDLKPVLSLWAEKINDKVLKKGQRVGYGGVFVAKEDMSISTYDIGYGDGFFRYNGKGKLYTKDKKLFLGKISMDSSIIESDSAKICLFDDVKEIASFFDTISYDVLTKLSPSISRIIVD